MFHANWYLS